MDDQTVPTADDLVAQVAELAPSILADRAGSERERRLSDRVNEACRQRGLFRMYRPRERGGFGFDPVAGFRVVEALSRLDSAVGWNVAIANAVECFGAWLNDDATEEIFGPAGNVMAGGLFPPRKATQVDGGYRVSGKALFNSNCHAADWFLVEAMIHDGGEQRVDDDGNPQGLFLFVPASEVEIVDNWDTLGMCGTGSHDVELKDVYVPEGRTAPLLPLETPGKAYGGPMHRLTVWPAVTINGVPALGIAQAAIDDFVAMAADKVPAYTSNSLRDRPIVQLRLGVAEAKVRAARSFLYETFDRMWGIAKSGRFLTLEERADCQQAASFAIGAAAEAVDLIHSLVSSAGLRKNQPFERHLRDIRTITQHAFVCESRFEAVGQVRLGLDANWDFFYF